MIDSRPTMVSLVALSWNYRFRTISRCDDGGDPETTSERYTMCWLQYSRSEQMWIYMSKGKKALCPVHSRLFKVTLSLSPTHQPATRAPSRTVKYSNVQSDQEATSVLAVLARPDAVRVQKRRMPELRATECEGESLGDGEDRREQRSRD